MLGINDHVRSSINDIDSREGICVITNASFVLGCLKKKKKKKIMMMMMMNYK